MCARQRTICRGKSAQLFYAHIDSDGLSVDRCRYFSLAFLSCLDDTVFIYKSNVTLAALPVECLGDPGPEGIR